jgi:hypothetical protein
MAIIPVCALCGERIFEVVPMHVGKYFRKHPEKLIWWTPFSKRHGLCCRIPVKVKIPFPLMVNTGDIDDDAKDTNDLSDLKLKGNISKEQQDE